MGGPGEGGLSLVRENNGHTDRRQGASGKEFKDMGRFIMAKGVSMSIDG